LTHDCYSKHKFQIKCWDNFIWVLAGNNEAQFDDFLTFHLTQSDKVVTEFN